MFRIYGSRFLVQCVGLRPRVGGLGFSVSGFKVSGVLDFTVDGVRASGLGLRI